MMRRCYDVKQLRYTDYGARGIQVCERWHAFENFREDMKMGYEDRLTLDRIDPFGNYEPTNCRWATYSEQNRNKRKRAQ